MPPTILSILDTLSGSLGQGPLLALAGAAGWGLASMLLSPCHLAGIPLIVGFVAGTAERPAPARAAVLSLAFGGGILATIALVAVGTALLGRAVGDLGPWGSYAAAFVILFMGLHLLGVVPLPEWPVLGGARTRGGGVPAAAALGLAFGLALGPCTFAFLAPVLAASVAVAASQPILAGGLVVAFGVGHCAVLVGAGSSTSLVERVLSWNERSRALSVLRRASGVLLLAVGVYLVYTA